MSMGLVWWEGLHWSLFLALNCVGYSVCLLVSFFFRGPKWNLPEGAGFKALVVVRMFPNPLWKFLWAPQYILFQKSRLRHICSGSKFSAHPSPCCRDSHASAVLPDGGDFSPSLQTSPEDVLTCSCLFLALPFLIPKCKEHLLKWKLAFPWVFHDILFLEASIC